MKVQVHEFDYGTKIVSFGNYYEYDDYLSYAVSNTDISVSHLDVEYDKFYDCFNLYPRGHIVCGCCKKNKEISILEPAYTMYFRNKRYGKLVYKSLLCSLCMHRAGKYAYMADIGITKLYTFGGSPGISRYEAHLRSRNFTLKCIVRRWKRNARKSVIKKNAIAKLEPYILHWAAKPDGPLYNLAIKRLYAT